MATLVLTAVGTALGGPVGGALGSLVGQAIDTQLFGPGPRRGPRLDDLKIQTSSYGTQIPRIYGRMRVAGTVVWATDLKESEEIEGGGKGSPETVHYNYTCSFAVALSSRPIVKIGRIWADGKLIRGRKGDFKIKTRFRVRNGDEKQKVDSLFAEIEGQANSPAYRGVALAVFEDMELAEFGNRLPVLTFEVFGDDAPVSAEAVIADVCGPAMAPPEISNDELVGYAALGSDRRSAIEALADLASIRISEVGETLAMRVAGASVRTLESKADGWSSGSKKVGPNGEWIREAAIALPATLSVRYHEPSRDFQAGQMAAHVTGGRGDVAFDSAAAMEASTAKAWAERALARRWAGRDQLTLHLSPDWIDLRPGDELDIPWRAGRWVVEDVLVEAFAVRVTCRRTADTGASALAEPGRVAEQPDNPIGRSTIQLLDLPPSGSAADGKLQLHAAVSCDGAFKPVPLGVSVAGSPVGSAVAYRKARSGRAEGALGSAPTQLADTKNEVVVALTDKTQVLLNADDDALDGGANLAMLGGELLQFGRAADLGGGRFRLSRLLRGRRGTEWAVDGHIGDERFVMIDPAALVPMEFDMGFLGQEADIEGFGVADDPVDPPTATALLSGSSTAPFSPCQLRFGYEAPGRLSWCRRSLLRASWASGSDDAVGPATFHVIFHGSLGTVEQTVAESFVDVGEVERGALGTGPIEARVTELGVIRSSVASDVIFSI